MSIFTREHKFLKKINPQYELSSSHLLVDGRQKPSVRRKPYPQHPILQQPRHKRYSPYPRKAHLRLRGIFCVALH